MISFAISGEFLDLPPNPSVELKRFSTLFQFEGFVQDDYTFPIAFPNTPRNKKIFDFPHIVENASRLRPKWDAVLFYNGVPRLKGEIRAKNPINAKVITANFVSGVSLIGEDVKKRKIADLIDEEITVHELSVTKSLTFQWLTGSARCAIILNGKEFEGTDLANLASVINADTEATITASVSSPLITFTAINAGEFEPFHVEFTEDSLYVVPVLEPASPWLDDLGQAYSDFVENYRGESRLTEKIRFGTYGNLHDYATDASLKRFPIVNFWSYVTVSKMIFSSFGLVDLSLTPKILNNNSLAPMITLKAVLDFIASYYAISIDFFALNEDDLLFHTWTLDRPVTLWNNHKVMIYESSFNLSQLVPDITVNEFLTALQVGFNAKLDFDPDTRLLVFSHRQPMISARPYEDITLDCSEPSDIQLSPQQGIRFSLRQDDKDVVDDLTLRPEDYLVDEGERIIQAAFGAPGMRNHLNRSDWPQVAALNTVLVNLSPEVTFPLKFVRYVDDEFTPFLDSQPFVWQGVAGLINSYWKDSLGFENNPVTITNTWLMSRNDIFNVRWGQRWRIDRNDYLLQSFSVGLLQNVVTAANCIFVKLPNFVDGELPVESKAWRALASSFQCIKDSSNQNTGVAYYQMLEEYFTETGIATGITKLNITSDPDYIEPVENLSVCPLVDNTYQAGKIYIIVDPVRENTEDKVRINGTEYLLQQGNANSFPYPYVMGETTQIEVVANNNPKDVIQRWRVQLYKGATKVYDQQKVIGPDNLVYDPLYGYQYTAPYRTFLMGNLLYDIAQYHRVVITIEDL